jgi:hypothetical protein
MKESTIKAKKKFQSGISPKRVIFAVPLLLALALPFALSGCEQQTVSSQQVTGAVLLPGQQIWKNEVSSYLFGANDTQEWNDDNIETDPHHIIQPSLKAAKLPLMRSFFFDIDQATHQPVTDAQIETRIKTIENVGAQCLGVIFNIHNADFAKHLVTYLGRRCNMYEFGNEPDLTHISVQEYLTQWNSLIPQLRAINPRAKFMGPVTWYDDQNYIQGFLAGAKASKVLPDAVTFHHYGCWNQTKDQCIAEGNKYAQIVNEVRGWATSVLGHSLPLGITEWNYNPGSGVSWGQDATFMKAFTTNALNAMISAHLDFANQFDVQSYSNYGDLDMFDIYHNDAPKAQFAVLKNMIAQYYPGT